MFDDGRFFVVSSAAVCSVFLKPGVQVPAGLTDVYLAAFTMNAVDTGAIAGCLFVLVGVK